MLSGPRRREFPSGRRPEKVDLRCPNHAARSCLGSLFRLSGVICENRRNLWISPSSVLKESAMFDLSAIQAALRDIEFGAWLLCDFRGSNLLARRILDLADKPLMSRRFFYLVPARGEPQKL